ncbi:nucleotidyltransferase domain-containing protein [Herbiconiux sp. A18JL235]|uniref:Nucleotidyltransferase domain-containing protein n=1 Tax=Herbiconiux sp. A18JL235 TaxID=3152363 RepID=A0AB39BDH8_9MICO
MRVVTHQDWSATTCRRNDAAQGPQRLYPTNATSVEVLQLELHNDRVDLESPLRTIASPVEAEVLRVLAGADTEFGASQVHRLVDSGSAYGVRKALARLSETGLVTTTQHGNYSFWRGNRDHVLWPAVQAAVDARQTIIDRLQARLTEHGEVAAYLYGSFARRTAGPDSDVDVLVVHPDESPHDAILDIASDIGEAITTWTGNVGHVYSATRSELREALERGEPVALSIRGEAVTVVGPPFGRLLDQLGDGESACA